jgi:hypothetical protein
MVIGRPNSIGSDTRRTVSWKVEKRPNSGKNCFGSPARDAGHRRVPAPPHMMSWTMRSVISSALLGVGPIDAECGRIVNLHHRTLHHQACAIRSVPGYHQLELRWSSRTGSAASRSRALSVRTHANRSSGRPRRVHVTTQSPVHRPKPLVLSPSAVRRRVGHRATPARISLHRRFC